MKQTQSEKGKGEEDTLTLKQTQSEKGRVRRTRPHENMVRKKPQSPIPSSLSSARK